MIFTTFVLEKLLKMKITTSKLFIISVMLVSFAFIGCKKDEITEKNQITFGSKNYNLKKGYQAIRSVINNQSPKSNVYEYDLMLTGAGLSYDSENEIISGQGDYLFLTMFSLDPESIAPGQYTFDRFSTKDSLTFIDGVVGLNSLFSFGTSDDLLTITNGVVNVTRRGNTFQLDFEFYTESNNKLAGSYSGTIETCTFDYTAGNGNINFQGDDNLLTHGVLEYNGYSESYKTYVYILYLYGTGITYDASINELSGKGNYLGLALGASSPIDLPSGKYVYDDFDFKPFVFVDGILGINNDLSDPNDFDGFYIAEDGNFIISRDRRNYIIDLDLVMDDGNHAEGGYTGFLEFQVSNYPITNFKNNTKINIFKNHLK